MGKILSLVESLPIAEANRDCIATLEAMLELAQRGELVTLGIAAVCRDGDGLWMLCDADKPSRYLTLSGVLRRLEMDIDASLKVYDGEDD